MGRGHTATLGIHVCWNVLEHSPPCRGAQGEQSRLPPHRPPQSGWSHHLASPQAISARDTAGEERVARRPTCFALLAWISWGRAAVPLHRRTIVLLRGGKAAPEDTRPGRRRAASHSPEARRGAATAGRACRCDRLTQTQPAGPTGDPTSVMSPTREGACALPTCAHTYPLLEETPRAGPSTGVQALLDTAVQGAPGGSAPVDAPWR